MKKIILFLSIILFLYPNNLKSWELGKEVPSIFCPERVTIAGRQGTSEDEKLKEKPTKTKTNSSSCLGIHATDRKLESFYRIEGDNLINYQGVIFPKIAFHDSLHEDLCFVLKDPDQANIIHKAYLTHILPNLSGDITFFSNALLKVCVLFGSTRFSPENSLIAALSEEGPAAVHWLNQNRNCLNAFLSDANQPACPYAAPPKGSSPFTVAILTTSASGGNHSVTMAIQRFLSSSTSIECVVIDVEKIAKESDPIMLATGCLTYDGIYAEMFQQSNCGMDVLFMRDDLSKELGKYIPSCLGLKLKKTIRELHPDLILSTRSYTIDDIPLCTLGIPFRMIHCDYELSYFLMNLYGKVNPEMLKFWLPSLESQLFRPLFIKENRLDLYDEQDSFDKISEKISLMTGRPLEEIQGQFELLGYPVCPEFYPIEKEEELHELRKKWNLQKDEIPVLVSMGKNGVGVLEEIFDQLKDTRFPIKYFFVCGRNLKLKERLEQKALGNDRFAICGLLSLQEMNELMNLCTVKITKPGGSLTSEAFITHTYLLMMCSHPWEEANGSKVERMGFGQRVQADRTLSQQVEECIEKAGHLKRLSDNKEEWKGLLLDKITKKMGDSVYEG